MVYVSLRVYTALAENRRVGDKTRIPKQEAAGVEITLVHLF
jgi:hypothetical protein